LDQSSRFVANHAAIEYLRELAETRPTEHGVLSNPFRQPRTVFCAGSWSNENSLDEPIDLAMDETLDHLVWPVAKNAELVETRNRSEARQGK
jgi:hypothetical protein